MIFQLHQPLQTNDKQFKIAVTFLTCYIGLFNVMNGYNKFYFTKSMSDEDGFIRLTIPQGAYEIESLNNEIKRKIIKEEHYTEANYPFTKKPNFTTLGSIIRLSTQGPVITFVPVDSVRDLLGFNKTTLYEEYNLSPNPVDILSFDKIFLECNVAQGMIFWGKRSGIFHNFTMDVDPVQKYIKKFWGGVQCYMMESKDVISSVCFKLKVDIERNKFCGQVSTIMRVISNKDGDLLHHFDNFNENDFPVLERFAELPAQIKSTPDQKMLKKNHIDANEGKIKKYFYLEDIFWFCKSF